jgi:hypothetical protein
MLDAGAVSLRAAARAIDVGEEIVDRLVRKQYVLGKPAGRSGKGGRLMLHANDLAYLWVAANLTALHVPADAIRLYIRELRSSKQDQRQVIIHRPDGGGVVPLGDLSRQLEENARAAAVVEIVDVQEVDRKIRQRLPDALAESPNRGRPRISKKWLLDGLDESSGFGDDTTPPERVAELIGRTP